MTGLLQFNDPRDMLGDLRLGAIAPVTAGERFAAEYEDVRTRSQGISEARSWYDAYERVGESFERDTGKELVNPFRFPEGPGRQAAMAERTRQLDEARAAGRFYSTDEDIRDQIAADLQTSKSRVERARAAPQSTFSEVAGAAGQMAGAVADPSMWPTMFVGAGAGSILRGALVEAAVGAGTQFPLELQAQAFNRAYGVEYGNDEVLLNTLFAGAGAGVLYGGLRLGAEGVAAAVRRLFPDVTEAPRPVRDALNVVEAESLNANLRPADAGAAAVHDSNVRHALAAITEGSPVTVRGDDLFSYNRASLDARAKVDAATERMSENVANLRSTEEFPRPVTEADLDRLQIDRDRAIYADVIDSVHFLREEVKRLQIDRPSDLTTFLVRRGGVQDQNAFSLGGDVRQMLGRVQERPGLVNNKSGLDLDEAALHAWQAGYLRNRPNADERPTPRELLDALREDFTGEVKHFPAGTEGWQARRQRAEEIDRNLDEMGVVWERQSDESLAAQLREALPREPDFPPLTMADFDRRAADVSHETAGTTQARQVAEPARAAAEAAEKNADQRAATVKAEVRRLTEEGQPDIRVPTGAFDADGRPVTTSAKRALETADARIRDAQALTQCAMGSLL